MSFLKMSVSQSVFFIAIRNIKNIVYFWNGYLLKCKRTDIGYKMLMFIRNYIQQQIKHEIWQQKSQS